MSIIDDAFKIATTGFDFKKTIDRHRGMYVRRRGEFLLQHNSSLQANQLATQLKAELIAIQNYIAGKDALINDNEAKHFDLKKGPALVTWSIDEGKFGERFLNGILKEALTNRIERVAQIVWRAVAIHSDVLWKTPGPLPQLQQAALAHGQSEVPRGDNWQIPGNERRLESGRG